MLSTSAWGIPVLRKYAKPTSWHACTNCLPISIASCAPGVNVNIGQDYHHVWLRAGEVPSSNRAKSMIGIAMSAMVQLKFANFVAHPSRKNMMEVKLVTWGSSVTAFLGVGNPWGWYSNYSSCILINRWASAFTDEFRRINHVTRFNISPLGRPKYWEDNRSFSVMTVVMTEPKVAGKRTNFEGSSTITRIYRQGLHHV